MTTFNSTDFEIIAWTAYEKEGPHLNLCPPEGEPEFRMPSDFMVDWYAAIIDAAAESLNMYPEDFKGGGTLFMESCGNYFALRAFEHLTFFCRLTDETISSKVTPTGQDALREVIKVHQKMKS